MFDDELPRHTTKKPRKKPFGIEWYTNWYQKWNVWKWYATEKERDQALEHLRQRRSNITKRFEIARNFRKIDR